MDHLFGAGLRSAILFPLVADSGVLGVFTLASMRADFATAQNIEIGERIGAQVAVALRARELAGREQQRTDELEALRMVSEAVGASLELSDVLDAAMDHATRLTGIPGATVRMVDDDTGDLVLTAHRNMPEAIRKLDRIPPDSPLGRLLIDEGRPHLVKDAFADERLSIRQELEAAGIHRISTVHAPMVWEGRTFGVISLVSFDGREATQADLSLLTAISRPIAAAAGNARLYQTLLQMDATRRRLLARLVRAQEEERQMIASDIHDDSIQVMTAVGMRLYSLRKRLPNFHWGRMSTWLQVHVVTGLVGAYLVLLHAAWKFNGLARLGDVTYVLIEQPDKGNSHFLKVGDRVDDAQVVRVSPKEIVLAEDPRLPLVEWDGVAYSVPPGWVGHVVCCRVEVDSDTLEITAGPTLVSRHRLQPGATEPVWDPAHRAATEPK